LHNKIYFICFVFVAYLFSCESNSDPLFVDEVKPPIEIFSPKDFPSLIFPSDNEYSPIRWQLGKKLFYDKRLSKDNQLSCASCHKQDFAFGSDEKTNQGSGGSAGIRNVPSLANVGYYPYFTREGAVPSLEMQVLVPIQEHNEFNTNILHIVDELSNDISYQKMSLEAYNRSLDPFVLVRAIATFERSLISDASKYDLFINDKASLNSSEKRGLKLFNDPNNGCISCHEGPLFTNHKFENNGLYSSYNDTGRYRLTGLQGDMGKFKTPSLRNLKYTAPYMHDGSLATLEEVVNHYIKGGMQHQNKSNKVKPLSLSNEDVKDLIAFLNTLNDETFIKNSLFK
jgi:cytochrome c peroxidase